MRVLAVNQFYDPDLSATAQLLTDLCRDLVDAGDQVTVIAGRGAYDRDVRLRPREFRCGVDIVRPWSTAFGRRTVAGRLADYGSFFAAAVGAAIRERAPDVLLALTTPPLLSSGAAIAAKVHGIPLVSWVQDVYPSIAERLGLVRPGSASSRVLHRMQIAAYRRSRRIVSLSQGMAQRLVAEGAPADRMAVLPNWADGTLIRPMTKPALGPQPLRLMYSGNFGAGHDFQTLIDAAKRLALVGAPVQFLFVGGGAKLESVRRATRDLSNVEFLDYQPRERLGESLAVGDVHFVTMARGFEHLMVPSKFYGIAAAGRPTLYIGPPDCEIAQVVRCHKLGWEGRPGDVEGLLGAVERLRDPAERQACGERARALFEAQFDRRVVTARWRALLLETAAAGGASARFR